MLRDETAGQDDKSGNAPLSSRLLQVEAAQTARNSSVAMNALMVAVFAAFLPRPATWKSTSARTNPVADGVVCKRTAGLLIWQSKMPALCVLTTRHQGMKRNKSLTRCTIADVCEHATPRAPWCSTLESRSRCYRQERKSLTRMHVSRQFVDLGHLVFEVGTHTAGPRSRECCCSRLCTHARQVFANKTSCFR